MRWILIPLTATVALIAVLASCEDTASPLDPRFNWVNDPPSIMTVVNDGGSRFPVRIDFHTYATGVTVRELRGVGLQSAAAPPAKPGERREGGKDKDDTDDDDNDDADDDHSDDEDNDDDNAADDDSDDDDDDSGQGVNRAKGAAASRAPHAQSIAPLMPYPMAGPFSPIVPAQTEAGAAKACTEANSRVRFGVDRGVLISQNSCTGRVIRSAPAAGLVEESTRIGNTIYATRLTPPGVVAVDRTTGAVTQIVALPADVSISRIARTPGGGRLYVAGRTDVNNRLFVIDIAARRIIAQPVTGSFVTAIAVSPDGDFVWVSSTFTDAVLVYDTVTHEQAARISVQDAWAIAFSPDGSRAYALSAFEGGGSVKVIDTSTYAITATIPVGNAPREIEVTPTGRHLFVANRLSDFISQIDTATNTEIRRIRVGRAPSAVSFVPSP